MSEPTTYLDMTVGRYRLGLRTRCVAGVTQEATPHLEGGADRGGWVLASVEIRGRMLPLVDLRGLGAGVAWLPHPFVITVDASGREIAVGADRIDYVTGPTATRAKLPVFGLRHPDLFEGVVRHDGEPLVLLDPVGLLQMTGDVEFDRV